MDKLNKLILINKLRRLGLFISVLFLVFCMYSFKETGSTYADLGVMFSLIGVICFSLFSKGY